MAQRMTRMWRVLTVVAAAAVSLAIIGTALASAPPVPPHKFYGSSDTGSAAVLDGAAAADGAVVTAWNESGTSVGTSTIAAGTWVIDVDASAASSVTFTIGGSAASASNTVTSGSFSEITLDLSTGGAAAPAAPAASDGDAAAPAALPNTGTGGVTGSNGTMPLLPLTLLAVAVLTLSGLAVTRRARQ